MLIGDQMDSRELVQSLRYGLNRSSSAGDGYAPWCYRKLAALRVRLRPRRHATMPEQSLA